MTYLKIMFMFSCLSLIRYIHLVPVLRPFSCYIRGGEVVMDKVDVGEIVIISR